MKIQRGIISIDILGGLIVILSIMGIAWSFMKENTDAHLNKQTAEHVLIVARSAERWIQKNQSTVSAAAVPLATYSLTDIASELPTNFASANAYGQTYTIRVYKTGVGHLETLVLTTGGQALDNKNLRTVANMIGGMAGYIDTAAPSTVQGVFGGWAVPVATYGASPGAGHLAVALFLSSGGLVDQYVYRNAVSGHPEYNTMTTPLIMASVQTVGGACTQLGAMAVDATGAVVSCNGTEWKLQSTTGSWKDPVATYAALPLSGNTLGDTRVVTGLGRIFIWNGGAWAAAAIDQNGDLSIPGNLTVAGSTTSGTFRPTLTVAEGSSCLGYPEGTIAQSSTTSGLILSCQSSVWKKASGGGGGKILSSDFAATFCPSTTIAFSTPAQAGQTQFQILASCMLQKRIKPAGTWSAWANACNISSGSCTSGGSYTYFYYTVNATGVQEMLVSSDSNGVVGTVIGHGIFSN